MGQTVAECQRGTHGPGDRTLGAQGLPYVKDHYDKQEVMLPMRDGTRLFTSIYSPRDHTRTYPFLLERTPYGVAPYGPDAYRDDLGPSARFGEEGFIFVYQDVRGRMMSEGTFLDMTPALPHTGGRGGREHRHLRHGGMAAARTCPATTAGSASGA